MMVRIQRENGRESILTHESVLRDERRRDPLLPLSVLRPGFHREWNDLWTAEMIRRREDPGATEESTSVERLRWWLPRNLKGLVGGLQEN